MSLFAKTIKDEIQRLSRREIKQVTSRLRKDFIALKRVLSDQKLKIAELEKLNRALTRQQEKLVRQQIPPAGYESGDEEVPIYSKSVRSLRRRLGVSQAGFAKLVGVSINSVVLWEKKSGKIKIRKPEVRKAIGDLKGMKKAEVFERLGKRKTVKKKKARK